MQRFRLFSCLLLALAAGLPGATACVDANVTVWPREVELHGALGEPAQVNLHLLNGSDKTAWVKLDFTDWVPGPGGGREPVPLGSHDRTLAPYMVLEGPAFYRLDPGEHVTVPVRVQRDYDERGGTRWAGISVYELPAGDEEPAGPNLEPAEPRPPVRLRHRQTVRLYHTVLPAANPGGTVVSVDLAPGQPRRLAAVYRNDSERIARVTGEWRMVDRTGNVVWRGNFRPFLAYPRAEHVVHLDPLPQLPPGAYTLLVILTPEGGAPVAGQTPVLVGTARAGEPASHRN